MILSSTCYRGWAGRFVSGRFERARGPDLLGYSDGWRAARGPRPGRRARPDGMRSRRRVHIALTTDARAGDGAARRRAPFNRPVSGPVAGHRRRLSDFPAWEPAWDVCSGTHRLGAVDDEDVGLLGLGGGSHCVSVCERLGELAP